MYLDVQSLARITILEPQYLRLLGYVVLKELRVAVCVSCRRMLDGRDWKERSRTWEVLPQIFGMPEVGGSV